MSKVHNMVIDSFPVNKDKMALSTPLNYNDIEYLSLQFAVSNSMPDATWQELKNLLHYSNNLQCLQLRIDRIQDLTGQQWHELAKALSNLSKLQVLHLRIDSLFENSELSFNDWLIVDNLFAVCQGVTTLKFDYIEHLNEASYQRLMQSAKSLKNLQNYNLSGYSFEYLDSTLRNELQVSMAETLSMLSVDSNSLWKQKVRPNAIVNPDAEIIVPKGLMLSQFQARVGDEQHKEDKSSSKKKRIMPNM